MNNSNETQGRQVEVLAVLEEMQHEAARVSYGGNLEVSELIVTRAAVAELIETQRETLRMLEAAHRQLGMWTDDNPRIQRAKSALARVGGAA